jgi:hypothetical protein
MAILNNLSDYLENGLIKLHKLEETQFNDFVMALTESDLAIHPGRLAENLLPRLKKKISVTDIQDIFVSTTTLIKIQEDEDFTIEDLINDVLRLVNEKGTKKLKFSDEEDANTFKERLTTLLTNDVLCFSQKVSDVFYDHEKLFTSVDISTDIRPVFTSEQNPQLAVLGAVLRLDYRCEGESRNIYLGIDRNDIKMLKGAIEKAEKRIQLIEGIIEKAGMKELKMEKE